MMSETQSFSYAEAARLGRALIARIKPFCDNGAALWAGSWHRQQPQVKDREIVAVPLWAEEPAPPVGTEYEAGGGRCR